MLLMTEATKQAHAELRKNHPWVEEAIEKMGVAMDLFAAAAQVKYQGRNPVEAEQVVIMQMLGIRVMNSTSASADLISSGYFQQAAMLVRDILECAFLLDLFSRRPEHLQPWVDLGLNAGKDAYRPAQVRNLLKEIDGPDAEVRDKHYGFYSRHATHPNSRGLLFIAPVDHAIEIGPFANQQLMLFLLFDLTRFTVMAAQHLAMWFINVGAELSEGTALDTLSAAFEANGQNFLSLNAFINKVNEAEGDLEVEPAGESEGADE